MKKRIAAILWVAIVSCAVMALVDGVLKPGYAIKSAIKLVMFLGLPLLLSLRDRELSLKPLLRFKKLLYGNTCQLSGNTHPPVNLPDVIDGRLLPTDLFLRLFYPGIPGIVPQLLFLGSRVGTCL